MKLERYLAATLFGIIINVALTLLCIFKAKDLIIVSNMWHYIFFQFAILCIGLLPIYKFTEDNFLTIDLLLCAIVTTVTSLNYPKWFNPELTNRKIVYLTVMIALVTYILKPIVTYILQSLIQNE